MAQAQLLPVGTPISARISMGYYKDCSPKPLLRIAGVVTGRAAGNGYWVRLDKNSSNAVNLKICYVADRRVIQEES